VQIKPKSVPDFEELEKVIKGMKQPSRVHLVELGIDEEVKIDAFHSFHGTS